MTTLVQSLCARARELVSNGHTLPEKRALSQGLAAARIDLLADRIASLEARHREVDAFYIKTCLQALKEHIDWRDEQMVKKFQGLELGLTALHTEVANRSESWSTWGQTVSASIERLDRAYAGVRDEFEVRVEKAETAIEEIAKDTDEFIANVDSRLAGYETNVTSAVASAHVTSAELAAFREAVNRVLRIDHA